MLGDADGREGLVDLHQVQLGRLHTRSLASGLDGVGGLVLQRGVRSGDRGVGGDLREPGQAEPFCRAPTGDHHGGCAVGQRRGRPRRQGAVRPEGRPQGGHGLEIGVDPDPLVLLDDVLAAAASGHRDRYHLVGEHPRIPGRRGPTVAVHRKGVLIRSADLVVAAIGLVGQSAHGLVGEVVPEAVPLQRVVHHDVPVAEGRGEQMRSLAHRFHPAGHHDVVVTGADQLIGQHDGVHPGQADVVHRHRRHGHRDARGDCRDPGRVLPGAGGHHVAHHHIADGIRGDARPLDRGADRDRPQLGGSQAGQRPAETPGRCPRPGQDDGRDAADRLSAVT